MQPCRDIGDVLRFQPERRGLVHQGTLELVLFFDAVLGDELRDAAGRLDDQGQRIFHMGIAVVERDPVDEVNGVENSDHLVE